MAVNDQPLRAVEPRPTFTTSDTVWVAACLALCGGWAAYLFTPYVVPQMKDSPAGLLAVALVVGVAFAVVGAAFTRNRD